MKQILIRLSDGRLAYSRPCADVLPGETEDAYLQRVAERTIDVATRDGVPGFDGAEVVGFVDDAAIPDDPVLRKYRDAWTTDGSGVHIDIERARVVALTALRKVRDEELARLDIQEMKHAADAQRVAQVRARKQELRDMPATVAQDLAKAETVEELEAVRLPD